MHKNSFSVYRLLPILTIGLTAIPIGNLSPNSIHLYLKPAPFQVQESVKKDLERQSILKKKLENISAKGPAEMGRKLVKNRLKKFLPKICGFAATYGGYVDYSNKNGCLTFPLIHKEPKIHLVITSKMKIAPLYENTVSHEELKENNIKIYLFERKKDEDNTPFWQVSQEKIGERMRIDPLSIVLLTNPKNIVVPTGDFMSAENPNLILPNIYVVGNLDNSKILLNFLDKKRLFESIAEKEKTTDSVKQKILENN